jgi:hypothetical protein
VNQSFKGFKLEIEKFISSFLWQKFDGFALRSPRSDYREQMTLQLFPLAIGVVLNHQTNPFSNGTKFSCNKVKHKNLNGRSLDFF